MSCELSAVGSRRQQWQDLAILLLIGLLIMGAGLGLRDPWPPDEPRNALVAREMVDSGDWLIAHRGGEPYPDKPPVFFWLVAAVYAVTGSLRVAFLLPSLLAGLATLALVHDLALRLWNRRIAACAGFALLATVQFTAQARAGQIDAVLVLWTTLALYGLLRHLLLGPAWAWWYLAFAAMGLGIITKGVGFLPLLLLIPCAVVRRRGWPGVPRFEVPWWRLALGPLVMVATAALWAVPMLIAVASRGDPALAAYRDNLLFTQTGERYVAAWHHLRWAGYFLLEVAPWAWLPLTLALPWVAPAWWRRLRRGEPRTAILLGWVALVLLFFSASPGKRSVYILPAAPALVLAAAPLLPGVLRRRGLLRLARAVAGVVAAVLLAAGTWLLAAPDSSVVPLLAHNDLPAAARLATPLLALGVAGVVVAIVGRRAAVAGLLAFMGLAWLVTGWWVQPLLNTTRSSAPLMAKVAAAIGPEGELAIVQWREQLVLHADRKVTHFGFLRSDFELETRQAADWARTAPRRFVMLPRESLSPCFLVDRCLEIGTRNRREWLLAPSSAIAPACAAATPPSTP